MVKYQATKVDSSHGHADTGVPCAGIAGNPFHDITWLVSEGNTPLNAIIPRSSNPPTLKLQYFLNLHNALKAHTRSKHKLGQLTLKAVPTHITRVYFP